MRVNIRTISFVKPSFPPITQEEYLLAKEKIKLNPEYSMDPEGEQSLFTDEQKNNFKIFIKVLALSLLTLFWTIDIFMCILMLGGLYFLILMISSSMSEQGTYVRDRNSYFLRLKTLIMNSENYQEFLKKNKDL
ncbi:MAG: hypothetical protein KGZ74_04605 [Chitinophagaceae bacterium]|nr:hypothetical protein [Chitinophagaceae bacterium]